MVALTSRYGLRSLFEGLAARIMLEVLDDQSAPPSTRADAADVRAGAMTDGRPPS